MSDLNESNNSIEESNTKEILAFMRDIIDQSDQLSEAEIEQRQATIGLDNGIGYLVTSDLFHLRIIKLPGKNF